MLPTTSARKDRTRRPAPWALSALLLVGLAPGARAGGNGDAARPFPPPTRVRLEAALSRTMAEFHMPGAVVSLSVPGQGTWVTARGVADTATKRPMAVADHVRIGSITKTFTVTVLLQLAGEKALGLDDPVSRYGDFVPNGDHITLRMLANMTSGLFSYTQDDAWVHKLLREPGRRWTARQLVDVGLAHPPRFAPGTGWDYCNTNTVLLGLILEKVTGKPIGEVFRERIFRPLGLKDTVWPRGAELPRPYARGYTEQTPDGKKADATGWDPSWGFTAGMLISDLADLRVWARALATGALLTPEMQRERLTWVTLPPNTPARHYGLGIGEDHGWIGHTGELPGYNTAVYYLPARDAVLVVEVNCDIPKGKENPAPALVRALARIVTPDNVPE